LRKLKQLQELVTKFLKKSSADLVSFLYKRTTKIFTITNLKVKSFNDESCKIFGNPLLMIYIRLEKEIIIILED
jgi:hypothetical protein